MRSDMEKGKDLSLDEEPYTTLGDVFKSLRVRVFPLSVMLLIAAFIAGLYVPIERGYAEYIVNTVYETYVAELRARSSFSQKVIFIFMKNAQASIMMILPIMGFIFSTFSMFWSGTALQAFSIIQPGVSRMSILTQLFSVPSTWIEIAAYSLAFTESLCSTMSLLRKRGYHLLDLILVLVIVESMLFFSACIETLYLI